MDIFVYLLANLFRMYIIYRFMNLYYGEKKKVSKVFMLVFGFFYIINCATFLMLQSVTVNIICNVIGVLLICFLYSKDILKNIFGTVIIYAMGMAGDIIVLFTVKKIFSSQEQLIVSMLSNLIVFFMVLALERIHYIVNKNQILNNKLWFALLVIPAMSIVVLYVFLIRHTIDTDLTILTAVVLCIFNFTIFKLYDNITEYYQDKMANQQVLMQLKIYHNQKELLEQMQKNISSLCHDMKHHFNYISNMAIHNKNKEIVSYIETMQDTLIMQKAYVKSGNYEIDSVLNYLLDKAHQELKKVEYEVKVPIKLDMDSYDIILILSNIIVNAIEAAAKAEEKFISISVREEQSLLIIKCINSFNNQIKKKGNKLFTTKADYNNHGIGLANVRRVITKYDGEIKFENTDQEFSVFILLYMK